MIQHKLNTYGFVNKVEKHNSFKKYMMNYIKKQPTYRLIERLDDISNTDWKDSYNPNRPYVKKFAKLISPYLSKIGRVLKTKKFTIGNMWYQQYGKGSKHQWHHHVSSNWSAVYYLELPNNLGTELYDITESRTFDIKLNEGDLFLFPANMLHRSPPNMTNKIKTIISFNIDFNEVI